jgi:hypothetical protein
MVGLPPAQSVQFSRQLFLYMPPSTRHRPSGILPYGIENKAPDLTAVSRGPFVGDGSGSLKTFAAAESGAFGCDVNGKPGVGPNAFFRLAAIRASSKSRRPSFFKNLIGTNSLSFTSAEPHSGQHGSSGFSFVLLTGSAL